MSFMSKEERLNCWNRRDEYWKCLDEKAPTHSPTSGEEVPEACKELRKMYESNCPVTWVKHFDRKRNFEQYKEKLKSGYEPLDERSKQNTQ